ncbi:MAG: acetoacetate decarboxylase family protein [Candidatus Saccharibacteria bacterium]
MNKGDIFKGIKQWPAEIDGHPGQMPIFYPQTEYMAAGFTASTKEVKKFLPDPLMHPVEFMPGRAMVMFVAFEYAESDLRPYNEFAIAFLIKYGCRPIPGLTSLNQLMKRSFEVYVWHLPVTTEAALAYGKHYWGFPKFVSEINFTNRGGIRECTVGEKGVKILTLRGKQLNTKPSPISHFRTYSVKDGITLIGTIYNSNLRFAQHVLFHPDDARLEIYNQHPISKDLLTLDLSEKPVVYQYSDLDDMVLFGGRNLIDR